MKENINKRKKERTYTSYWNNKVGKRKEKERLNEKSIKEKKKEIKKRSKKKDWKGNHENEIKSERKY